MEAILLVGGLGTRLHPLTLTTAKPMLPLGNLPITEHQLLRAATSGIRRVILSTSYLSESFKDYFQDGSAWGVELIYAIEEEPLGTAGAILNASRFLTSETPVFIFNGDVISHHNLARQLELHNQTQADATLHLLPVKDVRPYGKVTFDERLRITEFLEKPPAADVLPGVINAGCYIFNPAIIESIPFGRPVSVEREIFPKLVTDRQTLTAYLEDAYWLDLGTPARYLKANLDLLSNGISLVGHSYIDPTATITNSVIGSGVTIGANVSVSDSLILDGVRIQENSHISHTILGNDVSVAANSRILGIVAGDNLTLRGTTFPQSETIGVIETGELR